VHQLVGYTFWDLANLPSDNGSVISWGLVTPRDNAYDGTEACVATGTDAAGYAVGGELDIATWQSSHAYVSNGGTVGNPRDIIQATVSGTRYQFVTTTSGTSGMSTPNWAGSLTVGQTVSDGTVIWTNSGVKPLAACFGDALTPVISANQLWLTGSTPSGGGTTSGTVRISGSGVLR